MKRLHRVLSALMLLAALPVMATCAKVLGLDDYVDAAGRMCGCPGPQADPHCADTVAENLNKASSEDREDWLSDFVEHDCDSVCDFAVNCYNRAPVCKDKRPGCECCFYDNETPTCTGSTCATCKTCADAIAGVPDLIGMPDRSHLCASSKRLLDELSICVCSQCSNPCGSFCNSTGGVGCSACITLQCNSFLNACQADLSQPP